MSTLRVNITLERAPGVATAHIRFGNRWAKATLRNVSNDQLMQIAMGDNEVLLLLWKEAQTRGEAWVKFGPKDPFVKLGNCPLCPRPWRIIDRQPTDPYFAVMDGRTIVDADGALVLRTDSEVAMLIVDAVNERDRLRDLVRRMATQLSRSCPEKFGDWTREGDNACSLIAEARAAIGEGTE